MGPLKEDTPLVWAKPAGLSARDCQQHAGEVMQNNLSCLPIQSLTLTALLPTCRLIEVSSESQVPGRDII